ncbi:MAG: Holliday junction resolvase RecU [Defluviitaleaceae bacterium]|nr:Holliday junction resolvase RecU [Defluviitaleaceae bacterium]
MGYWNTRGLRGSTFEDMINMTNDAYRAKGLALVLKLPTGITPTEVDNKERTISRAYFEKRSAVDYIGAAQGVPICFDAKETARKSLPLQNIHAHQIEFMREFEAQRGVAFLLVRFTATDEIFYLPFKPLKELWDAVDRGGRKSIPYDVFEPRYKVENKSGFIVHYLEQINIALTEE